jgi:hypothetical protein
VIAKMRDAGRADLAGQLYCRSATGAIVTATNVDEPG